MPRAVPIFLGLVFAAPRAARSQLNAVTYMRNYFSNSFDQGDRVIFTTRGAGEDNGSDKIRAVCMTKGHSDFVLEPVTFVDIHSSLIRISSRAACAWAGDEGMLGNVAWAGEASFATLNDANSSNASACSLPAPSCCATAHGAQGASLSNGMPFCTDPTPMARTDSWYGEYSADIIGQFTFKVPSVNGEELSEITASGITASWTIEEAKGVNASVVTPPSFTPQDAANNPHGVNYGAAYASNGHSPWAMYDGGVMVTATIGASFTYRMFLFKDDATLEAARQVEDNLGLTYAHPFPGSNGCNAEVVYEFKPAPGGGLTVGASLEQLMMSVARTTKWYATELEVVVTASRAAFKGAARYPLPDGTCAVQDIEIIRFSRSFICKSTGARVDASAISGPEGHSIGTPANPSTYNATFPDKMSATESDPDFQQPHIGFHLSLTAEQAPESCVTMYWDPYLQSPLSQSTSADAYDAVVGTTSGSSGSSGTASASARLWSALAVWLVVAGVAVGLR